MVLKVAPFAGCCGSAVIYGFKTDHYLLSSNPIFSSILKETEEQLQFLFRPQIGVGNGLWLKNTAFIHAVLNNLQMANEPLLLKMGFVRVDRTINKNTFNTIYHYIKVQNKKPEVKPKKAKRMFGN